MHKWSTQVFINDLEAFVHRSKFKTIFDKFLAEYFIWYLCKGLQEGHVRDHELQGIYHYLTHYIKEAFDKLRTEQSAEVVLFRKRYEEIDGYDRSVPNLTEIAFGGVRRALMISHIGSLLEEITGQEWLRYEVEKYFFAQDEVLNQSIQDFVRKVYLCGLRKLTVESDYGGYSAEFGPTKFRSLETAGRILFTFARKNQSNPSGEDSVTLIGDAGEKTGICFGAQSVHTDLFMACSLIKSVIAQWPPNEELQKRVLRRDKNIRVA